MRKMGNNIKTYTVTNIDHVVEIATTLPDSWFRGHSKVFGNLTPGIFRELYKNKIQIEYKMIDT